MNRILIPHWMINTIGYAEIGYEDIRTGRGRDRDWERDDDSGSGSIVQLSDIWMKMCMNRGSDVLY